MADAVGSSIQHDGKALLLKSILTYVTEHGEVELVPKSFTPIDKGSWY